MLMILKKTFSFAALVFTLFMIMPYSVRAHEAYVIDQDEFWSQLHTPFSASAFNAWKSPHNVEITIKVAIGVLVLLGANYLFRKSKLGQIVHRWFDSFAYISPLFTRAAISASLFLSAYTWHFLGPEMPLTEFPLAGIMRALLFAASIMIGFGFLTELGAILAGIVFTVGFSIYGLYLVTYLQYVGELIVLFLFGMRRLSVDQFILGPLKRLVHWEKYEISIVRICYGLALMFAAITVKFGHPALTSEVAINYNLSQFHWLFPSDPLLIVLGAGIAEAAIGLFIILGLELRLMIFIGLFYITLSLLYFKESVWPHWMLYGTSLSLLFQPEIFTIDHFLFSKHRKKHRWYLRPFTPHTPHGKSSHKSATR
jgi:hypothetical protein